MPAPAVYFIAVIGTIAAGVAFKEFVYDPHIAPILEQWAEEFVAMRQANRRRKAAVAMPVPLRNDEDHLPSLRRSKQPRSKHSDSGDEGGDARQSIELENLVAKEVREWRTEVNRSQIRGLRHRSNAGLSRSTHALDESTDRISIVPMSPTHVIFDPSLPSTPSSTLPSTAASPSTRVSKLHDSISQPATRSQPPPVVIGRLPTPDPSTHASPLGAIHAPLSPASIPSLSQAYPLELDLEQGLELLSAPSSRPDSPFSALSHPLSAQDTAQSNSNYYSFSSPNANSPNFASPLARPPSRSISDLDFLSDLEEHGPLSPRSFASDVSTFDEPHTDDGARSEISGSSWASGGVHSH
ncbi:hypothetical protein Hypma_013087 [Hypsizygus marmoreus]|uniref:Uncharacterized protein n=1 Tax=Hypsizygus marmoreus TaxID=39966 RepID=A0A369JD83_HYPMA|nr:hypothetical protein Hypma_013087 [Hypsizygus marmoreus]